jgi:hypothetical protein
MIPHLEDLSLFQKYIKKSKHYFEFGSGGSTTFASQIETIESIHSVESDKNWANKVLAYVKKPIQLHLIDFKNPGSWGSPGSQTTNEEKKAYSDAINKITTADTILVDGRFRVACALKAYSHMTEDSFLLFDDFLNRPNYHIILNYFIIVERGKIMVVLKKGPNEPPKELIEKYELNQE